MNNLKIFGFGMHDTIFFSQKLFFFFTNCLLIILPIITNLVWTCIKINISLEYTPNCFKGEAI